MSIKKSLEVKKILERSKKALNIKRDRELADLLGVGATVISMWKRRNNIDLTKIVTLCEHINNDWLIYGRGSMKLTTESEHILDKINMILRCMNHDEQKDILRYAEREIKLNLLLKQYQSINREK